MNDEKYPHEIDLGRKVKDWGSPVAASEAAEDDEEKTKTIYPCLYISGTDALSAIPDEGCFMIKARVVSRTTREHEDKDEPECSVELEVEKICLPDGGEEDDDLEEKMGEFLKAKGLI